MSIKIHANRVLGTIHVTKLLGVFKVAQIKSGPRAPTDLNAALYAHIHTRRIIGKVVAGFSDVRCAVSAADLSVCQIKYC